LDHFALLDDSDIMTALKTWAAHPDKVLSVLADGLLNRNLLAIEIQDAPFKQDRVVSLQKQLQKTFDLKDVQEAAFFVFTATISNNTYSIIDDKINILCRDNTIKDIANASDMLDLSVLGKTVKKQILCYPKVLR
jgi:hypothetical protein